MKFFKFLTPVLVSLAATFSIPVTHAATDNTEINISHTYVPYVNFIGTAPGASRFYDNSDIVNFIFPVNVNLGTMGLESNISGDCDLDFSTVNDFKLLHTVSNQNLADYRLLYQSQQFDQASNQTLTIPCNTTPTDLDFILTGWSLAGFDPFILAGIYQDVVTVTVTTQ